MLNRTQALLSRWLRRNSQAAARRQRVQRRRKSFLEPLEGRNLLATFHVALTGNDANSGGIDAPFRTIQAAITAASSTIDGDDFINVATGVYNTVGVDQRFTIGSSSSPPAGLSNLQLLGGWDATFTTRNPAATPTDYTFTNSVDSATRYDIPVYHPNTTIDGFTFRSSDGTNSRNSDTLQVETSNVTFSNNIVHVGIHNNVNPRPTGVVTSTLNNSVAGLKILNNQFHANYSGTPSGATYAQGIFLNPSASTGVTISGNSFQGNNFATMLTISSFSGVTIDDNDFIRTGPSGFQALVVRGPQNPPGASSNIAITNNNFDGGGVGAGVHIGSTNSTLPISGVTISDNSISNSTAAVIFGVTGQTNSISGTSTGNIFSGNGANVVYAPLGTGGSTTINGASINPGSNTVTASTTADQNFKLVRSGGNLEVYDVTVPASPALILSQAIGTAALTIAGAASFDNTLTIDFTGGNPIPSGGLVFDGGTGGNDKLAVVGDSTTTTAIYSPSSATTATNKQGSVQVGTTLITFSNLEPVDISGMTSVSLASLGAPATPLAATNVFTIANGFDLTGAGTTPAIVVSGTTGGNPIEEVAFFNNTTVIIDTSSIVGSVDSFTVSGADATAAGITNLTLNTGTSAGDVINVTGAVIVGGSLNLSGTNVSSNASGTIQTGTGLTVTNTGTASSLAGVISGTGATLTKAGSGRLDLSGSNTYTGGTVLNGGTLFLLGNQASLGAVQGDRNLTVTGTASLNGNNSVTYNLGTLAVGSGVTLTVDNSTGKVFTFTAASSGSSTSTVIHTGNGLGTLNLGNASAYTGNLQSGWGSSSDGNITFTALSDAVGAGNLQAGGGTSGRRGKFTLTGDAGPLTFNNRKVEFLNSAVTGTLTLVNANTNAANRWVINTNLVTGSATQARTLEFDGVNTGANAFAGVIANTTGAGVVGIGKVGTGTWALSGANTYTGKTIIGNGALSVSSLNNVTGGTASSNLGAPTTVANGTIDLGSTTSAGRLIYTGTGETTDRVINLAGTTGGGIVDQSGTGLLKFTSSTTATGAGIKSLTLQGSTAGTGEIAGVIVNNSGTNTTAVSKAGTGTWTLSGNNTFTGNTTISGGSLVAANVAALGAAGRSVTFSGTTGVLDLATNTSVNAYNVTIGAGNAGTIASNRATAGAGINHVLGTGSLSTITLNVIRGLNVTSGSPQVTFATVDLMAGAAGTTTLNPTTADLSLGNVSIATNNFAKTLALGGTSTGNAVTGLIANGLNVLSLSKVNTGTWTVSGSSNTYTGATTVQSGNLISGSNNAFANSPLVVGNSSTGTNSPTLDLTNFNQTSPSLVVSSTNSAATSSIIIGTGKTLTINGNVTIGANTGAGATTNVNFTGGGSFAVSSSAGTFQVGAATGGTNTNPVTASLAGLGSFNASLGTGNFQIGDLNTTSATVKQQLTLAPVSSITANQLLINNNNGAGGGIANASRLVLGSTSNALNVNTISIGDTATNRGSGIIEFGGATGSVTIRSSSGATGTTNLNMVTSTSGTGTQLAARLLLAGHNADVSFNAINMSNRSAGTTLGSDAEITFDNGTFNANSISMVTRSGGTLTTGASSGTITIGGGTANLGTVTMATNTATTSTAGPGAATATLNITGGAVTANSITMANAVNTGITKVANATINLTGGSLTMAGNITRTGGTGTENTTITVNGGTLDLGGNNIGSATTIGTLNFQSGTLQNVAQINNGAAISKSTTGVMTFAGTNGYTGATSVAAGTLIAASAAALGSAVAGTSVTNNATLDVRANIGAEAITALLGTGVGGNGALITGSGSGTVGGPVTLTGNASIGGAGSLTINGDISGATFGVTKIGLGTTTLGGTNNYTGATAVNDGILAINGSVTSNVTVNAPGELNGTGTITGTVSGNGKFSPGNSPGTMTIVGAFNPSGTVTFEVNSPWTTGGTDYDQYNVTGTVNLTGATLNFANNLDASAPTTFQLLRLINNDGTTGDLTTAAASPADGATVTIGSRSFRLFYNGEDGNNVVLVEASTPTVVYVEDNDWDLLTIGSNIADADFGTNLAQPAIYGVNAFNNITDALNAVTMGGTVIVNGGTYAEAVVSSGTRTIEITGPDTVQAVVIDSLATAAGQSVVIEGSSTLTIGDATSTTIAGVISGSGSLVKQGAGTLTLSSTNTYGGATVVNAGTLQVDGAVTGTGAVNVNNSAILAGNGSLAGTVSVNNTARLAPGGSPESLATGALSFASTSFFDVQIGGTTPVTQHDQVVVTGAVTLGGATLNLLQLSGFTVNSGVAQQFVIISNDGTDAVSGTFAGLPEGTPLIHVPMGTFYVSYSGGDGNDVVLYSQPTVNGTAGADTLVLRQFSGTQNEYSLNGASFVQVTNTLPFTFNGLANTDLMLVDTSNGDPIPTGNATFNGELLRIQKNIGAASDTATHVPSVTAGSGLVTLSGFGNVNYTGATNVDFVNLTTVNVQTATVNDTLALADGNTATNGGTVPGTYSIAAAAALTASGANAIVGLRNVTNVNVDTVTGGTNGNDSVTLSSGTGAHGIVNLAIATGTGTDTVTVAGALTVSGNINISSQNIAVNATLTGGGASTVSLNAGTGGITTSGTGIDVVAQDLAATATTGINLDTTVLNITATSSGTGNVNIDETNGANVLNVSAATGTATVTSSTGILNVTTVSASTSVTLTATAGSITDANAAASNVSAASLTASAATGIDLDTTIATLTSANVTGVGAIDISDTAGGLIVTSATTTNGAITLNATGGDLTLTTVTAGGTANVTATTTTSGSILVGNVTATSDTISLTAIGSIEESGTDTAADISASILLLTAGTGIGGLAQIEIDGNTAAGTGLTASVTGTGVINLRDVDGLRVNSAVTNNGSITLEGASGSLTLTTVTAGGTGANITANTLAGSGTIAVGALTATGDTVTLSAFTNITDDNAAAVNVVAATLNAAAGTGVGSADPLETTIDSLTATNATSGNIQIVETNAITLTSVVQSTDNDANDIVITAGGTITVGVVNAGTTSGDVTLTATVGSIIDNISDATADVIGDVVTLTAVSGVGETAGNGSLDTTANSLDVSVTAAGLINLSEANAVTLVDIDTFNGPITIVASGTMTATNVASLTDSDANDITLTTTAGNIAVGTILAGAAGDAFLTAAAAITDVDATNPDITADDIVLLAGTGVGTSSDPLETVATNLESSGGTGGVYVANTGALTIGGIGATTGLSATGGTIVVTTTGSMTVTEDVTATGSGTSVSLTAIDAPAAGQNLVLNASTTISSALSSVTLNAGDNATITGDITSGTITTINVDFGDAESAGATATAGDGGTLTITGIITTPNTAAGGAFLNGGNDYDTFTFNPQTTTAFYVDGDLPVGGTVGDVLQMNVTGTSNPNLTVPGNATVFNGKSYDGPGSGTWTFDPSHREVRFKSIEDPQITGPYHLTYDNSVTPVGNLVIMLDATAPPNQNLQFRDGSVGGPILYELDLAPILSVRVLGGTGADVVTIDDINGLPSFGGSVPAITGVGNNTFIGDSDATPLPEFFFDAGGGTNTLTLNLTSDGTLQQWALGTGTGAAGTNEGELQTTNASTGLNAYVRNVNEINRTSVGTNPGGLTVFGDNLLNTISIADNTVETRISATGYPSFDFSGNNYTSLVVNGQADNDLIDLVSFGSGQTNNPPITLNGNDGSDTIRVRSTSGNTNTVTLNGNAGNDTFQLYDGTTTAGSVDNIAGLVVVDGSDGNVANNTDTLQIIDNSDTSFDTVLVSAVNPTVNADYAVEGINGLTGNDVTFRNVDVLEYTGTQGNDLIDGQFVPTTPTQHDLSVVTLNGWTGGDQFLLFTSDQLGGTGVGFTPTGVASGVGMINLNGDAPGNPNAGDGNDIFGQTPSGIIGTGVMNVGLVVDSDTRMIRPSATTGIAINGGQPTGIQPPAGDELFDRLNLDITALPNTNHVIVSTFLPGTVVAPSVTMGPINWAQIEDMNLVDQNKLTNVQMGDLFARTTPSQDLIQFSRNATPANPSQVRLRITSTIGNYSASNKTIVYAGGLNDTITQADLTIPAEFYGEDGNDNISGGVANDWLVGGLGNDRINGSRGDNVIWGDNSPTLPTDPQPQDLAIGGNDILSGLEGADVFYGGGGDDQVSAGGGNDYAYGGQGNDSLDGHDGDDRLYGGLGNDIISGFTGNDLLVGNANDDKLYGQEGNDVLFGGAGADLLDGGEGNDLLVSGRVGIESSSWTGLASTGTYSAATYTNPMDNDFALISLLAQWAAFSDPGTLGTSPSISHDGDNDDLFGSLGDDDFCWELADVVDNPPGVTPPDFDALNQGNDERFGPS